MSDTWAAGIAQRVAAEIRRLRGEHSGQWLSDRTAELGHRVSRTTISELENGKRMTVSVDALIVLAAALDVAVADLLYPGIEPVELLPGRVVGRGEAIEALAGTLERVDKIQEEVDELAASIRGELLAIRKLNAAVEAMKSGADQMVMASTLAVIGEHAEAGRILAERYAGVDSADPELWRNFWIGGNLTVGDGELVLEVPDAASVVIKLDEFHAPLLLVEPEEGPAAGDRRSEEQPARVQGGKHGGG